MPFWAHPVWCRPQLKQVWCRPQRSSGGFSSTRKVCQASRLQLKGVVFPALFKLALPFACHIEYKLTCSVMHSTIPPNTQIWYIIVASYHFSQLGKFASSKVFPGSWMECCRIACRTSWNRRRRLRLCEGERSEPYITVITFYIIVYQII